MNTETPTPSVADHLAQLERELSALLPPLDLPDSWSPRERDDYEGKRSALDGRIRTIRTAVATLAQLAPKVATDEIWQARLAEWRQILADELLAMPKRVYTAHDRGVRQNLMLSISMIDQGAGAIASSGYALETLRLGKLMRESGYVLGLPPAGRLFGDLPWFGATWEVERRLQQFTAQREDAEARLAEALLDDAARAQREAEQRARLAELRAKPTRKSRGDGSQYDRYPDGRVVEVTS